MDSLKVIDTTNLHHSYFIEDDKDVFNNLQNLIKTKYKDDEIHIREFDSFGIDDSRSLINLAKMRSLGTQLFIYKIQTCTREAQNALLKLFEEPPERTHFFFCIMGINNILPTLLSRVWVINSFNEAHKSSLGNSFMKASAGERIGLLEKIIKDKDISTAEYLLCEIEIELQTYKNTKDDISVFTFAQQHIINVRKIIQDNGASLKVLLESVALITPRI